VTREPLHLTHPVEDVHHRGDPLGRSYTPDACALAIMRRLLPMTGERMALTPWVLEPCVGGGAFVRAAKSLVPSVWCAGYDVDPEAPGLGQCSLPVVLDFSRPDAIPVDEYNIAVTNPPFGKAVGQDTTLSIVRNARLSARISAMLLPVDVICQAGFEADVACAAEVWPLLPRPWPHERGMVVLVHVAGHTGPTVFRPLRWRAT